MLCFGAKALRKPQLLIVWLKINRNVVQVHENPSRTKPFEDFSFCSLDFRADANCEQMIAGTGITDYVLRLDGHIHQKDVYKRQELVTDDEIDKLIDEAVVAEETEEIEDKVSSRLDELRDRFEKNRQKQS